MFKPMLQLAAVGIVGVAAWKLFSVFLMPFVWWFVKIALLVGAVLVVRSDPPDRAGGSTPGGMGTMAPADPAAVRAGGGGRPPRRGDGARSGRRHRPPGARARAAAGPAARSPAPGVLRGPDDRRRREPARHRARHGAHALRARQGGAAAEAGGAGLMTDGTGARLQQQFRALRGEVGVGGGTPRFHDTIAGLATRRGRAPPVRRRSSGVAAGLAPAGG